mmetsp:Transcript_96194/g.167052  ORF Transcript_96194/g.167052 Transcript_96194/m.167052 type:complete len:226 (-) Transcript_96194:27-704(-)
MMTKYEISSQCKIYKDCEEDNHKVEEIHVRVHKGFCEDCEAWVCGEGLEELEQENHGEHKGEDVMNKQLEAHILQCIVQDVKPVMARLPIFRSRYILCGWWVWYVSKSEVNSVEYDHEIDPEAGQSDSKDHHGPIHIRVGALEIHPHGALFAPPIDPQALAEEEPKKQDTHCDVPEDGHHGIIHLRGQHLERGARLHPAITLESEPNLCKHEESHLVVVKSYLDP